MSLVSTAGRGQGIFLHPAYIARPESCGLSAVFRAGDADICYLVAQDPGRLVYLGDTGEPLERKIQK